MMKLTYQKVMMFLMLLVFLWPIHAYLTLVVAPEPKTFNLVASIFNLFMIGVLFMRKWKFERQFDKVLKSYK